MVPYLNKLCQDGMAQRYPDDDGTLQKRLEYELGIIKDMGFVDYFLIVWDYINYCRENDIAVGGARFCGGQYCFLLFEDYEYRPY